VPLTLSGDAGPAWIASGAGSLWVTTVEFDSAGNTLPGSVLRIDPATGTVLATIAVGKGAYDIAVGFGSVWVPNQDDNTVSRIDAGTNQAVATIPVSGGPGGIAADSSAVWVVSVDGSVSRVDPATNQVVATIQTQATGGAVGSGSGAVWVTNPGTQGQADGTLTRIDPLTNQVVASTPLGRSPGDLAVASGSVWVGMQGENTVVRVSATTNAVLSRVAVSAPVYGIEADTNAVWAVHDLQAADSTSPSPPGTVTRINYGVVVPAPPPTPMPTPTPTPTTTPTPTPTPSTGGTLVLGSYFMLALPAGWTDQSTGDTLHFQGPGAQFIVASSAQTNLTLDQVSAQVILYIKSQIGADPEQTEAITMGGAPGRLLTYHFALQGQNVYMLDALCVHNGRAYEIGFANMAGTESADRALFEAELGSFAFLGS